MSLEIVIQENTNVMREFLEALRNLKPQFSAPATVPTDVVESKVIAPPAKAYEVAEEKQVTKADEAVAVEDTKEITYQEAANAVVGLSKAKGREVASAVLAKFGAQNLKGVKPEQFADVIAACEAAGAQT